MDDEQRDKQRKRRRLELSQLQQLTEASSLSAAARGGDRARAGGAHIMRARDLRTS
jgi:hypothetical protein